MWIKEKRIAFYISSPPFGSFHNSFQSSGKIYEVKFSFLYNSLPQPLALRENNRNVVVVMNRNNRNVEKEKRDVGK